MTNESQISNIPNNQQIAENEYVSILEKTNDQLSLWWNPYGVMVGTLSFLVTFLAIAVAFVLYKQGVDYKNKQEETRKKYEKSLYDALKAQEKNLEKIITDWQKTANESVERLNAAIIETKELLKTASKESKAEIEKKLKELTLEKERIITPKIHFGAFTGNQLYTTGSVMGLGGTYPYATATGSVMGIGSEYPYTTATGSVMGIGSEYPYATATGSVTGIGNTYPFTTTLAESINTTTEIKIDKSDNSK